MKILFITEKDAANSSLGKIAQAFLDQGNEIAVYAAIFDEKVLAFFPKSTIIGTANEINQSVIDWCDIIVCSTLVSFYIPICVFTAHKPIFTHNYLLNRQINWGGDISFVPSQATVASDYDEYMNYSYIGIGEPKYDSNETLIEKESSKLLFIDSGHYPFSIERKRELAKTLLHICNQYPDYNLIIKPRFLPTDKVRTHKNNIHLYDMIIEESKGKLPENIVMLNHHEDLRKLIDECCTVICMYTTAFVGAVVAGKGLVVLEHLPTTDVFDIRNKTFMRNRENIIKSGALIDYHEVEKLLPNGVRVNETYVDYLLEEKEDVANKIVEVCTYLWENFYSKNVFPHLSDTVYQDYKNCYYLDVNDSWNKVISRRCYDYMMLKSLIFIDFHVAAKLDVSMILENINSRFDNNGLIDEMEFKKFLSNANDVRDDCIIHNCDRMLGDFIDSGILLNAYYLQKQYNEIRRFSNRSISAFYMFRAFIALEDKNENDVRLAKRLFELYFQASRNRSYILEISDMPYYRIKSYEMIIEILLSENNMFELQEYYTEYICFYTDTYNMDITYVPLDKEQKKHFDFINDIKVKIGK